MAEKKHYNGTIGDFWYDPELWALTQKYTEVGAFDILVYCGHETDGSRIEIPEGITSTSYMFAHKGIKSAPVIPCTVRTADYMFEGNQSLTQGAALPYGLVSAAFMYKDCHSLLAGSDMPDTLACASHMYENCYSLQLPVRLSSGLSSMVGLYKNCKSLTRLNDVVPKGVRADHWDYGCVRVQDGKRRTLY